jgi:hypothetical protein
MLSRLRILLLLSMSSYECVSHLISSIDWSNFVNARSHHGNVDLQTVGKSQLEGPLAPKADL